MPQRIPPGLLATGGATFIPPGSGPPVNQGLLDAAALASAPIPVAGDAMGLLADASRFVREPESRTIAGGLLAGAGLLPFVPSMGIIRGLKSGGDIRVYHGTTKENAEKIIEDGVIDGPASITPREDIARDFALSNSDEGVVFEFGINKNELNDLRVDLESFDSEDLEEAISKGASLISDKPIDISDANVIPLRID